MEDESGDTILESPANIKIHQDHSTLYIARRWFSKRRIFMVFFSVAWNVGLYQLYLDVFEFGFTEIGFATVFLIVGIFLVYISLARLVNTTYISIDKNFLIARDGPIITPGNNTIPTQDLKHLYMDVQPLFPDSSGKSAPAVFGLSGLYAIELYACIHSGPMIKIATGLEEKEQALFITKEVNKFLGSIR